MPFFPPGGTSGGGGVRHVDRRPDVVREGQIIYVRDDYQHHARIELELTTVHLGNGGAGIGNLFGFSSVTSTALGITTAGGTLEAAAGNVLALYQEEDGIQLSILVPTDDPAIGKLHRKNPNSDEFNISNTQSAAQPSEGD